MVATFNLVYIFNLLFRFQLYINWFTVRLKKHALHFAILIFISIHGLHINGTVGHSCMNYRTYTYVCKVQFGVEFYFILFYFIVGFDITSYDSLY